jgi:hypothetical protein
LLAIFHTAANSTATRLGAANKLWVSRVAIYDGWPTMQWCCDVEFFQLDTRRLTAKSFCIT